VVALVVRKVDLHAGNKEKRVCKTWRKDTVADLGRNPPVDLSSAAVGSSSTRRHPAGAQNAQI
jgi:hypothetical protein